MNRKDFIKNCGYACLGVGVVTALLEGCSVSNIHNAAIEGDDLIVPVDRFRRSRSNQESHQSYIIVQNEVLLFPICIYRFSNAEYEALWMRCTHQGAALQVFGEKLHCPAHGSEFSNRGIVQNGPALDHLRKFPVAIDGQRLKISLKAIS